MSDSRRIVVPEGLVGLRADVGIARVLGLSRTAAASVLDGGGADLDGQILRKSDLLADGLLTVALPSTDDARAEPAVQGGLPIIFEDDDVE